MFLPTPESVIAMYLQYLIVYLNKSIVIINRYTDLKWRINAGMLGIYDIEILLI